MSATVIHMLFQLVLLSVFYVFLSLFCFFGHLQAVNVPGWKRAFLAVETSVAMEEKRAMFTHYFQKNLQPFPLLKTFVNLYVLALLSEKQV